MEGLFQLGACSSLATGMVLQNCRVVKQTGKKRGVVVLL